MGHSALDAPRRADQIDEDAAFDALQHHQQRTLDYFAEHDARHRPSRNHDYRSAEASEQWHEDQHAHYRSTLKHGNPKTDKQFPMHFTLKPLPPKEHEKPAKKAHDFGRNERRYHGHSPHQEYEPIFYFDGSSDEEYGRQNAYVDD